MYVDKEDRDVIGMCNENKRRSELTTTIGYIATQEQAMEYATIKAAQKRRGGDWENAAFIILTALTVIAATVAALAG